MSDPAATIIILAVLVGVVLLACATRAAGAWWRFRGTRLVTCPETEAAAAVTVDTTGAAFTAVFGGPRLWLDACSRWPSRRFCGQECLAQIKAAPDDCRVDTIARRWFGSKTCVFCRRAITETRLVPHRPALLAPDGSTVEWPEVAPERLPEAFRTHAPVCWSCHVTETFRRMHPELVTDRTVVGRL
jgi:hypothetical protein